MSAEKILILEDDYDAAMILQGHLEYERYEVQIVKNVRDCVQTLAMESSLPSVLIADVMLPDGSGLEVLDLVQKKELPVAVVVITAASSVEGATDAMRRGAFDYVSKPVDFHRLMLIVKHAIERQSLAQETEELKKQLKSRKSRVSGFLGESEPTEKVLYLVDRFAPADSTVLITGDSGTGKELIARLIHQRSRRAKKPYVVVDCGGLTENFLDSELFGHVRGAFTGAITNKVGLLKEADGGTVFLDEFGEIPASIQIKLLRFLQERTFRAIGSNEVEQVDVRIILATNRNLEQEVEKGSFRADLFYRINSCNIHIPPLRDRREDIPLLVDHFIKIYGSGQKITVDKEVLKVLLNYDWPGNVRELQHVIEHMILLCAEGVLEIEHLPRLKKGVQSNLENLIEFYLNENYSLKEVVDDVEQSFISYVLNQTGKNITKASEILKTNRTTLSKKIARLYDQD